MSELKGFRDSAKGVGLMELFRFMGLGGFRFSEWIGHFDWSSLVSETGNHASPDCHSFPKAQNSPKDLHYVVFGLKILQT